MQYDEARPNRDRTLNRKSETRSTVIFFRSYDFSQTSFSIKEHTLHHKGLYDEMVRRGVYSVTEV